MHSRSHHYPLNVVVGETFLPSVAKLLAAYRSSDKLIEPDPLRKVHLHLAQYADRTFGRFSGIPLPPRGLRGFAWLRAWAAWWAEILLIETPFRLGVLSSDLQAHDVHHCEWISGARLARSARNQGRLAQSDVPPGGGDPGLRRPAENGGARNLGRPRDVEDRPPEHRAHAQGLGMPSG